MICIVFKESNTSLFNRKHHLKDENSFQRNQSSEQRVSVYNGEKQNLMKTLTAGMRFVGQTSVCRLLSLAVWRPLHFAAAGGSVQHKISFVVKNAVASGGHAGCIWRRLH